MAAAGFHNLSRRHPAFFDAVVAAVVALFLMAPIVGLRTVAHPQGLSIEPHPVIVVLVAAAVFVLRLLIGLLPAALSSPVSALPPSEASRRRGRVFAGIGLAITVLLPFIGSTYLLDLGTTVLIYVMLGWGLNIVVGLAGLLDLGYVAFYGVGAYTLGLLATDFGWSFWEALPFCGLFAASFGILLGFPVLRLRGDYLAIVTLGFGEIIRVILLNWSDVTNGPNGIGGIPRPTFFGLPLARFAPPGQTTFADFFHLDYSPRQRLIFLYFVIFALALLTNFFTLRMRRLPVGRAWEALREDETACRALGINVTNVKLSAFAIGAMFGGFAGAFFATRQGFISPESFNFGESATIIAIVVLGGMGSQTGIVLAALALVTFPEFARGLADYRMILFGAAMVAIVVTRPRGLMAHRRPTIHLGAVAS